MNVPGSPTHKFANERWIVFVSLAVYLCLCVVWQLNTNAPWDDDCVTRYFNSRQALSVPTHFIDLWNRPLFILLFCIPLTISQHGILLMSLITAVSAYALYLAARDLKVPNAWLVVPLLTFQSFFFEISRSALAEPLVAAILCIGYLLLLRKKYIAFALLGSLIPLARLEASVLLVLWAYLLYAHGQWKRIPLLGAGLVLWSLTGTVMEGGILWILSKTAARDAAENRYGHQTFGHYFETYIYVVGPVVFYFFFIGLAERIYRRRADVFLVGQFVLLFLTYVVFSWKLNLGQAAGFLRHMVTLSPITAMLALYGFNYWIEAFGTTPHSAKSPEPAAAIPAKEKPAQRRKPEPVKASKPAARRQPERRPAQARQAAASRRASKEAGRPGLVRMLVYSGLLIVLTFLFFSKVLENHYKLLDEKQYRHIAVVGFFSVLFVLLAFLFRKKSAGPALKLMLAGLVALSATGYTLVTQPPDSHNSPERKAMTDVALLYTKGYLKNYKTYVNHSWFFWAGDLQRDTGLYKRVTRKNLEAAPDSSIIIWESHYSSRLAGDVSSDFFNGKQEFRPLVRIYSTDKQFVVLVFQKIKSGNPEDIVRVYDRFIAFEPSLPTAYSARADMKARQAGKQEEALRDYTNAIARDSLYLDAYFNRGLLYYNQSRFKEAAADFAGAAKSNPDYYQAHFNLAISQCNMNDYKGSIPSFTKVIALKPDYQMAYMNRGIAYSRTNEPDKAVADYTKAIELNPKGADAYYNRAIVEMQRGNRDKGCQDLRKAVELGYTTPLLQQYCN
jgi:tetratricopeptide (TPR) repeat protein